MPPRRKKKGARQPDPEPQHQTAPSPSSTTGSLSNSNLDSQDDPQPPPFFNATFVAHRLSPLHIGSQLDQSRLQVLSKRLRDTLIGDVVRGVQVGLLAGAPGDDGSLGRAGVLEQVEWRWIAVEDMLGSEPDEEASLREGSLELGTPAIKRKGVRHGKKRALSLELNYENARYGAVLFPDIGKADTAHSPATSSLPWATENASAEASQVNNKAFLHLPLLLLRVPVSLRSVIIDFLATTFDCRASPLRMGTRSLVRSWESWLAQNGLLRQGSEHGRTTLNKDAMLTLGFHLEPCDQPTDASAGTDEKNTDPSQGRPQKQQTGLKALDIIIPAEHVGRFVRTGEKLPPTPAFNKSNNHNRTRANNRGRGTYKPTSSKRGLLKHNEGQQQEHHQEETRRLRRKLAGGSEEEGWHWTPAATVNPASSSSSNEAEEEGDDDDNSSSYVRHNPFTTALAAYLSQHLALDLYHPAVRIHRLACDGFLLSSDGKLKIFSTATGTGTGNRPERGEMTAWTLVADLVKRAKGPGWSDDALRLADAAAATAAGI